MSHDIPHDILSENKEPTKDFHLKDMFDSTIWSVCMVMQCQKTLENTERTIKNRQSKETGNMGYKRRRQTTHYVLDTNIHKQTQITYTRHEPSHKQMGVKTNRASFLCGNRNEKCYW